MGEVVRLQGGIHQPAAIHDTIGSRGGAGGQPHRGVAVRQAEELLAFLLLHALAGESAGAWRDDAQYRLRRQFCDAGLKLGTLLAAAGDDAGAAAAYESVVACEPLHETAHRGLLLTLTRAGRRAYALRHYDRLAALLQQLELDPEEETVELYERIRRADIVPGEPDVAIRSE
jgi:DNA-binding SARP family transcriptional activator